MKESATKKNKPFVENNNSIIEQNLFIALEKKKLIIQKTNKFTSFHNFTK